MTNRHRPDPEAIRKAQEHASRKRVEEGKPAEDPGDAEWDGAWAKRPRKAER